MHRFFVELEPSITVMEQKLTYRFRYIMSSKTFDDAKLKQLQREAPLSAENATAADAAPQFAKQPPHVVATVSLPVMVD
ncbi:unnamed protein product [Parnassius apollo]|uniref:(apollo) hypothetical protein n=1 Tax=Parnassius apollo TaxID=110799 RepID=A0A8S3VZT5_PARAO|nr:unnamed protein product [Parnassius apollo]